MCWGRRYLVLRAHIGLDSIKIEFAAAKIRHSV